LKRIAEMTGGDEYVDDADALEEAAKAGTVFREPVSRPRSSLPFHYWLLFLAAGLLFLDVAARRLALDPDQVDQKARYAWARLRGLPLPPVTQAEQVGRLQARPAATAAGTSERAGRRFEGGLSYDLPTGADATAPGRPAAQAPRPAAQGGELAPQPEAPAGDLGDLLKAKKRVWEERGKKEKPEE
jgi:hypothetical protein